MAAYDEFAWFYHRYWNEEFHSLAFAILERIWLPRVPQGGRILDVCCGTGYLAALLTGHGFSVSGIDVSPEMVRYARESAPGCDFLVGDITTADAGGPYDGAVATFDSLNHIVDPAELQAAFRNVAAALRPGASFAFDMLLEEAYRNHWGESFALVRDDHVLTITGAGYDIRDRTARCQITMFRLIEDAWQRWDVEVRERCYPPEEIEAALRSAGFEDISCYDARDLGMGGQLGEGRTFFVAARP